MKKLLTICAFASMTLASTAQDYQTGISLENLNLKANPAEDFFEYACGGWMKLHPLPAAYSRYGNFDLLREENDKRINGILKELQEKNYSEGTVERKLSDLYKLSIDSARREQTGINPSLPRLKQLEQASTVDELFQIQLEMAPYGDNEFFGSYIGADEKNATRNILNVVQGGITLGQKDYYLDEDAATTAIREG